MVNTIYQKSFAALMKRPFRLWGISLLGALLCWLAGCNRCFVGLCPMFLPVLRLCPR